MSTKTEPNDAPISDIEKLPNDALVSQIEQLRAQLHAAEERERELNAELTAKSASRDLPLVKIEPSEPSFPLSPAPRVQSPHKSAASLGLMVRIFSFFFHISLFLEHRPSRFFFVPCPPCFPCPRTRRSQHHFPFPTPPYRRPPPPLISILFFPTTTIGRERATL